MKLVPEIVAMHKELTIWRHDIHAHPELAFEETRTADFVASQLKSYGIDVVREVGKTGVVGTLKVGSSNRAIGLRADMDALSMDELNTFAHKSRYPGRMHGCGHDGHTVMLLAAARYLAQSKNFDGIVRFVFQPAEEANAHGCGAKAMIEDGLFERFPIDNIFALHNAPGLKTGAFATRPGAIMASMDTFDVTIRGQGTHGAFPHLGIDPVMIGGYMLTAWQSIVSRNIDAQLPAVISATAITAGDSWNVIPDSASIKGSIRTFSPQIQQTIHKRFHALTLSIAEGFGAKVDIEYRQDYPVTINELEPTLIACDIAATIVGEPQVIRDGAPVMGSEDFGHMLREIPGCYLFIGNSDIENEESYDRVGERLSQLEVKDACMVHEPTYDFNDKILPVGATFFTRLVERYLN